MLNYQPKLPSAIASYLQNEINKELNDHGKTYGKCALSQ